MDALVRRVLGEAGENSKEMLGYLFRDKNQLPVVQQIISVMWPSFMTASAATIIFFTIFDPTELGMIGGFPNITRMGGYTIGFFCFWLLQIPLAWLLARPFGLGPSGVFWSVCVSECVLAAVAIVWFRRGTWKTKELAADVG